MTVTRLSGPGIAEVVTGYLGDQEDDLIFKRPVLQRLFLEAVPAPSLNWEQRPDKVKQKVAASFHRLERSTKYFDWWYSFGQPKYNLCGIDEALLFKSIILQAYPAQKEFWFVDIGAGDFQCGQSLADYLNSQSDLPKDILVNIVGLRAEHSTEPGVIQCGLCKQIRLGGFKIEDITREFERCNLPKGKIDLTVSRLTILHLDDKPGTFTQIHDMLRPDSGIFLCDRFKTFQLKDDGYKYNQHNKDAESYLLIQLLLDTGSPFIAERCIDPHYSCQSFLLSRSGSHPCSLPMRYLPSDSGTPEFVRESPFPNPWRVDPGPQIDPYYYGSKSLFDWLQKSIPTNRVFLPLKPLPLESLGLT